MTFVSSLQAIICKLFQLKKFRVQVAIYCTSTLNFLGLSGQRSCLLSEDHHHSYQGMDIKKIM